MEADQGRPEIDADGRARSGAAECRPGDLLDEIDDVLEENAEEFVKGYVQRGGE